MRGLDGEKKIAYTYENRLWYNEFIERIVEDRVCGLQHHKAGIHKIEVIKRLEIGRIAGETDLLGLTHSCLEVVCTKKMRGRGTRDVFLAFELINMIIIIIQ